MNPLDRLFTAWLAGPLSADEALQLQEALRDPAARRHWRALADLEGALAERGSAIVAEPAQASPNTTRRLRVPRVAARSTGSRSTGSRSTGSRSARSRWTNRVVWPWALAASVLLASGAAWLRYQPLDQPLDQPLAQQTGVSEVIPSIAVTAPIPATDPDLPVAAGRRLARGERVAGPLDLQWSDGSVGHLAARGTARVPEVDRGVVLEAGELAMTAVPQSSDTPLIVSTAHARCTVIGTRFSVRCAEDTTSLLVDEGRVLFQPIGGEAQLVQAGGQALAGHAQPPSAGLVGWWPLDDGQGDTARDASGQGHPGHLSGPQWTVQGLHFPGGDAHVSIAAHGRLQTVQDGDYSLSAWYLPEVFPTGNGAPSRDALAVIAGRSGWTLGLHLTPDGRFFMQHFLADHQPQTADSPILATPGQWSHVVGVVSRRLGYTQLAVDGVRMPTVTAWTPGAAGNAYAPSQPWVIGIGLPGDAECRWPAQGLIRAVRLYDRALDAHDIVRLAHDR